MVIDKKITNKYLQKQFFNIPTIRNQLEKRQLTFIGKVVRNPEDQIPTNLLTAWCVCVVLDLLTSRHARFTRRCGI